jgi:hypothetical protein
MCCRQLPHTTLRPISQVLPPITTSYRHHFPDGVVNNPPHHIATYYPGAVTNYHITLRPITQVLPPITTSYRYNFQDDVVNSHTTSPPITHVLPPITTSYGVLLPRCYRQLSHHINIIYPDAAANYHITSTSFPR